MGKRKGSTVRKTRKLMRKNFRERGKIPLAKYFAKYSAGDRVCITPNPSVQKAMPYLRFYGRQGTVAGVRGECYLVEIFDGGKKKTLIVHPVHLTRLK